MSDGENSKIWLIDELMAFRRSVSEIQDRLDDHVEEPPEQSSTSEHPSDGASSPSVGRSEDDVSTS